MYLYSLTICDILQSFYCVYLWSHTCIPCIFKFFHPTICLFCCFTSKVNSYDHCGTVSSPNHTFSWTGFLLTVPRRYFYCGSFMVLFCLVFAMSLCASVYECFVVTCWERVDLLALVCGVYFEFVTFPLVSWVRCGT